MPESSSFFDNLIVKNAEFWALDSASRTNGLNCTLRRIEIYNVVPGTLDDEEDYSTSSISESTQAQSHRANVKLEFSFIGSHGPHIGSLDTSFFAVAKERITLYSFKDVGASEHINGADAGEENKVDYLPRTSNDLPPGFDEVRKPDV